MLRRQVVLFIGDGHDGREEVFAVVVEVDGS